MRNENAMMKFLLMPVALLVLMLSSLAAAADDGAAVVTTCSEAGNSTCLETNQVCLRTGSDDADAEESCGACRAGYIQVHPDSPEGCQTVEEVVLDDFVRFHNPKYRDDAASEEREVQLKRRLQLVSEWESQIPPPPFHLGVNAFAADTADDHRHKTGYRPGESGVTESAAFPRFDPSEAAAAGGQGRREVQQLPAAVNWVDAGAVTPVVDQGRCQCCWSISTAEAVAGAAHINGADGGFIEQLSFQQLVSCDAENEGCEGGNVEEAYNYAWQNTFGGLASSDQYPFVDSDGTTTSDCELTGKDLAVTMDDPRTVIGFGDTYPFSERVSMMKQAAAVQPVSISVDTDCDEFNNYKSGTVTDDGNCSCASTSCIDHAVLLVGYNDTASPPYWLVKNSWATSWGEDGYIQISQEGGGDWGLFGMLGQGIVPLKAYNDTAQVSDGGERIRIGTIGGRHPLMLLGLAVGTLLSAIL